MAICKPRLHNDPGFNGKQCGVLVISVVIYVTNYPISTSNSSVYHEKIENLVAFTPPDLKNRCRNLTKTNFPLKFIPGSE